MKDWEMGTGKDDKEARKKMVEIDSGTGRWDCAHVCVWKTLNRTGGGEQEQPGNDYARWPGQGTACQPQPEA